MRSRLGDDGAKAEFARKLNISPQRLNNWISREYIPAEWLPEIAAGLGISMRKYLHEAGRIPDNYPLLNGNIESIPLLNDFERLPSGLQEHITRKAHELRQLVDGIPQKLRPLLIPPPPKHPDRYREWEQSIEALMEEYRRKGDGF